VEEGGEHGPVLQVVWLVVGGRAEEGGAGRGGVATRSMAARAYGMPSDAVP